jgi:two-component system nitrogen regulation response regulator NtrX
MARILIVDDEENIRSSLKSALERREHKVVTADSYRQGYEYAQAAFDAILLDIMLPGGNGVDLLKAILKRNPSQTVVMISGHADLETAVSCVRTGAYDFIEKPISLDKLLITLNNALQTDNLREQKDRLTAQVYGDFVGESDAVKQLRNEIRQSAPRATRFLISGENGSGKELAAYMIHEHSRFSQGPFIPVNCAALPRELAESELFGHVKGAFTGAARDRKGRFTQANGGTIFLDEIGETTLEIQGKLLRVIETGELMPVGSDKVAHVNCNTVAATNRDLERMISDGSFRQDLYYRLNVVQFVVPPLRQRKKDLPLLARYFLKRFAAESTAVTDDLTPSAMSFLKAHAFPGNIRELRNLMERVSIYCNKSAADKQDVQSLMTAPSADPIKAELKDAVAQFEADYIAAVLEQNSGNMARSARQLGLERSHLYKKIKKHKLG